MRFVPGVSCAVGVCGLIALAAPVCEAALRLPETLPPHPRLLLNADGIAKLKQRVGGHEWAAKRWRAIKREADSLVSEKVDLPPRGGNWWHWYACPTHGAGLQTGKRIGEWQWEHKCPVGGEVLRSDPAQPKTDYDGCAISGVHGRLGSAVRTLGLVFQVTGDSRYAEKAREILLAYSDRYLSYPLHNVHGEPKVGGGRQGSQTLDEAVWLIPVCQGADLIWDTLSEADRAAISEKLLLPAAKEIILPHKLGIHNIQCWKNSAVGLVGLLLEDRDLIREAIYDADRGYAAQIRDGVTPDGGWWEGAWGYHFYTLSALWPLCEAARNCGIDLYGEKLKSMFDAPIKFASPSLRLPAFSDSGEVNLRASAGIYELAYARFGDPRYLELISDGDRASDHALWYGVDDPPKSSPREWRSENYPISGYAMLAKGTGPDATWLCIKYGPYGGGHGHPDKLGFVLYARGQALAIDPGTARYGLPVQAEWYRTTLAHNTLVVDEASQKAVDGKCIEFGSTGGVDFVVADAGAVYDGVHFTRTVALLDSNLIVFIDQVSCDMERLLDLACHLRGEWAPLPSGEPWTPPAKHGYKHLNDATVRSTSDGITQALASAAGLRPTLTLAGGDATEIITATGIGGHAEDRVPAAIFRRKAKDTAFVWCISLDGKPVKLERLAGQEPRGGTAVRVTGYGKTWNLVADPGGKPFSVSTR